MNIGETGIWMDEQPPHSFDPGLSAELCRFFEDYSVADIGCGDGKYTRALREAGVHADGWDGNPNTPAITNGLCGVMDFTQVIAFPAGYDWVLSLEVGEHIPAVYMSQFLSNLDAMNKIGIVISWAVPGQTGHGHINEIENSQVRKIFGDIGYVSDYTTEKHLRDAVTNCYWLANTIMVFKRSQYAV